MTIHGGERPFALGKQENITLFQNQEGLGSLLFRHLPEFRRKKGEIAAHFKRWGHGRKNVHRKTKKKTKTSKPAF